MQNDDDVECVCVCVWMKINTTYVADSSLGESGVGGEAASSRGKWGRLNLHQIP